MAQVPGSSLAGAGPAAWRCLTRAGTASRAGQGGEVLVLRSTEASTVQQWYRVTPGRTLEVYTSRSDDAGAVSWQLDTCPAPARLPGRAC